MDETSGPRLEAARRLYDLALDYAERSHAAEAELVRAFESDAALLASDVGELVVADDEDERLVLNTRGRLEGHVLVENSSTWESIDSPDEIVDYYDPTDLFNDLADAIAEAYPEAVDDGGPVDDSEAHESEMSDDGASDASGWSRDIAPGSHQPAAAPTGRADPPAESATLHALRDLHAAGVLSDAEFEARKTELGA